MEHQNKTIYFELLKMARELVISEYIDRRAQDHNKWLVDAEVAWKYRRVRIPYPTIPPYPTEKDIVDRAKILFDFVEGENFKSNLNPQLNLEEETQHVVVSTPPEKVLSHPSTTSTIADAVNLNDIKQENGLTTTLISKKSKEDSTTNKLLPSFLRKLEEMKKLL